MRTIPNQNKAPQSIKTKNKDITMKHIICSINSMEKIDENKLLLFVQTSCSDGDKTITGLGGAIGTYDNNEQLNETIIKAQQQALQNLSIFSRLIPENETKKENHFIDSSPIPQACLNQHDSMPQTQKAPFKGKHSTTKTASNSQTDFILKLCQEKNQDLDAMLETYQKPLHEISSAEANKIIQKLK